MKNVQYIKWVLSSLQRPLHSIYALMLEMRPQIHTGLHAKCYCCTIFITTKQLHKFLYISQKPCFEDIHSKVLELLHANKWTDKQTYERIDGKSFNLCVKKDVNTHKNHQNKQPN